ncbi:C40 family peptidase, partial [Mycobacteroides immunogenum]
SGATQPAMSAMQGGLQAGTQALSGAASGVTQTMSSMGQGLGQIPQALTGMFSGAGSGSASALAGGSGMSGIAAGALANPFGGSGGHASSTAGSTSSGLGGAKPAVAKMLLDPRSMGKGVQLFLPDGSTSQAPNASAAEAVRKALSQVGVPYEWGGTKPGVGLDCSGLTQWAYGESGVDIPRLAQEQGVGVKVDQGSVMPGDLAVWDGHVAMVIGNGMMVEAGDPVQISPIRTTNAGQGFHGFYRPTS